MMRWIATVVLALLAGFAGSALWSFSGLGGDNTRDYLMANPEVLPEAIEVLQQREMAKAVDPMRGELETPFPGAVLGNPQGSVTLVEFSDYACGYCRQSVSDVKALIAANPDLKVVIREYPILTPESADAARMALAAAQQGKFEAFHDAMYAAGQVSAESIAAAAQTAGLDMGQANAAIEAGTFEGQLQSNAMMAQNLGFRGTPAWVVGDATFDGAVGQAALSSAIETARES